MCFLTSMLLFVTKKAEIDCQAEPSLALLENLEIVPKQKENNHETRRLRIASGNRNMSFTVCRIHVLGDAPQSNNWSSS